jgi:ribose transport system ATP-binding protein
MLDKPMKGLSREEMVTAMGHGAPATARASRRQRAPAEVAREACISVPARQPGALDVVVRPGEVVGLAGLAGHGQSQFLRTLVSGRGVANRRDKVAFVAGDRRTDGIFSLWSIQHNLTIRAMSMLETFGFLNPARERRLARDWRDRIEIRAKTVDVQIVTLSGGNQQKVLFARALGSDASIILMDDPMRGVDIGTKQEVYRLIQAEADGGRSFVWYSTEIDELAYCDRVYVFRQGMAMREFCGDEINENNIVGASFAS